MAWEIKKLADVCDLQNGYAFKSKDYVKASNTLSIRMSNIRPDGSFNPDHNTRFLPDKYVNDYSSFLLNDGDLIIAMTDMAGDPKILGLPALVTNLNGRSFLLNQRVGKLCDFSDDIYVPYLRYYLSSPKMKEYYKSKGAGGLQINISKRDVLSADIPLPPPIEQKRIVTILDEAFADIDKARALTERNLENARELFQSYLREAFTEKAVGWIKDSLNNCFKLRSGDGLTKKDMIDGPYPVFGGNGIAGRHEAYNLEGDSVIIGRVGALCGNARFIQGKIWLTDNAFLVKDFKYEFDLQFLTYLLNFKNLRGLARQAAQPVISNSSLSQLELAFPKDVICQKTLARKLTEIYAGVDSLEELYRDKVERLESLKKSLLQKAFTGKLTKAA